ncbi:MAG: hypothetical protein FD151_2223 [bacterium]|nr:MAG: hypothetical protein FD151_2223 [bacterium]
MTLEAYDWNVTIVGYWNRAILTPAGIAQRLLGLEKGTPLLVEVAIDGIGPIRVKHDNLTIVPEAGRLVIMSDVATLANFDRAKNVGVKAIESLPETPFSAAGFNIRVKIDEIPDQILSALQAKIDDRLSDANLTIEKRSLTRTVKWREGVLNLTIHLEKELRVELNFHRQSTVKEELIAWLMSPICDVRKTVTTIFDNVIQISLGELGI